MTETFNASANRSAGLILNDALVTTAFELPGYRVVRNIGLVRGITVRSRSIVGNFFGSLQSLFGGNITIYTELCEQARGETYKDMLMHAPARCERDHRRALRRDRAHAGPHRSALLRHGGRRRSGLSTNARKPCPNCPKSKPRVADSRRIWSVAASSRSTCASRGCAGRSRAS
jgi:hypothetical protein